MSLPFISLSTCTFNRVSNLEEAVESFLRMEYAGRKELVVYNNSESQELVFDHPEVRILNHPRKATLGDIRNHCIEHCQGEVICALDDDDIHLPNHLNNLVELLKDYDYARWTNYFFVKGQQIVDICAGNGNFVVFRKDAWRACGGYPSMNAGEDIEFSRRLKEHCNGGLFEMPREKASFLYCWGQGNIYHISGKGFDVPGEPTAHERIAKDAQQKLARSEIPRGTIELKPQWKIDWLQAARDFLAAQAPKPVQPQALELVGGLPILSILINVLNDQDELTKTIESIQATAGGRPEIIVIDDASEKHVTVPPGVRLFRNAQRLGCGASRHLAACKARGHYFLIIDSHMRFEPGWYEEATRRIQLRPDTVYCAACLGLSEGQMDMVTYPRTECAKDVKIGTVVAYKAQSLVKLDENNCFQQIHGDTVFPLGQDEKVGLAAVGTYSGATLNIYGRDPNNPEMTQVFEGVWRDHVTDDQEIPCLMGASYFIRNEVFFKLGGLKQLKMWGSDEPYLSLKAWLAGYEIRIMRSVRIGHKFRVAIPGTNPPRYVQPYQTDGAFLLYNKIRCIQTIMSEETAQFLTMKLKATSNAIEFSRAVALLIRDTVEVEEMKRYYKTIFTRDLRWYCQKFQILYPQ